METWTININSVGDSKRYLSATAVGHASKRLSFSPLDLGTNTNETDEGPISNSVETDSDEWVGLWVLIRGRMNLWKKIF